MVGVERRVRPSSSSATSTAFGVGGICSGGGHFFYGSVGFAMIMIMIVAILLAFVGASDTPYFSSLAEAKNDNNLCAAGGATHYAFVKAVRQITKATGMQSTETELWGTFQKYANGGNSIPANQLDKAFSQVFFGDEAHLPPSGK